MIINVINNTHIIESPNISKNTDPPININSTVMITNTINKIAKIVNVIIINQSPFLILFHKGRCKFCVKKEKSLRLSKTLP